MRFTWHLPRKFGRTAGPSASLRSGRDDKEGVARPCHIGCWLSELQIPRFARDDKERVIFPERAATEPKRFKNLIWTSLKFSRSCGTDSLRGASLRMTVLLQGKAHLVGERK